MREAKAGTPDSWWLRLGKRGYSLNNIKYTVNPLELRTVSDTELEKIRVFTEASGTEMELNSPDTLTPDELCRFLVAADLHHFDIDDLQSRIRKTGFKQVSLRQSEPGWFVAVFRKDE